MKVPEGYVEFVEELPGANTQGATLQEARTNLKEALIVVMDANRELTKESLRGTEARRPSAVPRHREVNDFLAQNLRRSAN